MLTRSESPIRNPSLRGELIALADYADFGADWQRLEALADCSPFLSWAWVSVWLRHLPRTIQPLVFRLPGADGTPLALALLVRARERGIRRLVGIRPILVQETGDDVLDEITIEYAGLLVRRGEETPAYAALFAALGALPQRWGSLRISASAHAKPVAAALPATMRAFVTRSSPSYRIDLAALRAAGKTYLDALGSSTRNVLRKTRRAYEALGEVRADIAPDADAALGWLEQLRLLHDRYWKGKGLGGSFASRFFVDFHRDLVREGTASGLTQLIRISAGPETIGYLYNFVWRGNAYFYNAGLNYGVLAHHDRPGYLAQLLTIERHLADGTESYDLLAGDQQYKRSLSTESTMLDWIDVRPLGWRLSLYRAATSLLRRKLSVPLDEALASPDRGGVAASDDAG
ncbi:MAG TPA: GNAT family N-acetyltransferase [Rhodanobacteraceae bacterium]|nr:GNAT family N-acetyltransferase [Rhodanobacteraceae bacterium]